MGIGQGYNEAVNSRPPGNSRAQKMRGLVPLIGCAAESRADAGSFDRALSRRRVAI